jgi:predicted site-specific integrase-resolvase
MRTLSTVQVARAVGVHKVTLQRWLLDGKLREPRRVKQGGVDLRVWTDQDVDRVRKYKAAHYRKGRGRKKAQKKSGNR